MNSATAITDEHLDQIRALLLDQCGIVIGDARHPLIEESVARLLVAHQASSVDEFLQSASTIQSGLRDQLVNAVISRESAWFRDPEYFDAIINEVFPTLEEQLSNKTKSKLRFWSAGCSTGQEIYSLALAVHNHRKLSISSPDFPLDCEFVGTDVSPAALFLAVSGRYDQQAISSGLNEDYRARYFVKEGQIYALRDVIRRSVKFYPHNLLDPVAGFATNPFDLVLLRYVLEYYSESAQRQVIEQIANSMSPGGILFLGCGETLPQNDFFSEHLFDHLVGYRRKA